MFGFNFFKRNIQYVAIILLAFDVFVHLYIGVQVNLLFISLLISVFSAAIFFLMCRLLTKGYISDKNVLSLYFDLGIGIILNIIGLAKNVDYAYISLPFHICFITWFVLIKIFDIKVC